MNIDIEGGLYFSHQYGVIKFKEGVWESLDIENVPNQNSSSRSKIEIYNGGNLWWASNWYGVFSYKLDIASGISSNVKWEKAVAVYPNPAASVVTLEMDFTAPSNVSVSLFNNQGQSFGSYAYCETAEGNFKKTLDVSNLSKGVYHILLLIN